MATMELTPEMMVNIANDLKTKMESWDQLKNQVNNLVKELDSMWDGDAKAGFNQNFNTDLEKFGKLNVKMAEYQAAILKIAKDTTTKDTQIKAMMSK